MPFSCNSLFLAKCILLKVQFGLLVKEAYILQMLDRVLDIIQRLQKLQRLRVFDKPPQNTTLLPQTCLKSRNFCNFCNLYNNNQLVKIIYTTLSITDVVPHEYIPIGFPIYLLSRDTFGLKMFLYINLELIHPIGIVVL